MVKPMLAAAINQVNGVPTIQGFEGLFENALTGLLSLGGIVLFVMIIAGGFKYLTSQGDPKGVEEAKKTLTYAIAGIVLVVLAFLILQFIKTFTGANVTQFQIYK